MLESEDLPGNRALTPSSLLSVTGWPGARRWAVASWVPLARRISAATEVKRSMVSPDSWVGGVLDDQDFLEGRRSRWDVLLTESRPVSVAPRLHLTECGAIDGDLDRLAFGVLAPELEPSTRSAGEDGDGSLTFVLSLVPGLDPVVA